MRLPAVSSQYDMILKHWRSESIGQTSRHLVPSCNPSMSGALGSNNEGTMESMNECPEQRIGVSRAELAERIANAVREDGVVQPMPELYLTRTSQPGRTVHGVSRPSLCVI